MVQPWGPLVKKSLKGTRNADLANEPVKRKRIIKGIRTRII